MNEIKLDVVERVNGEEWQEGQTPEGFHHQLRGVTAGGNGFVAVGSDRSILTFDNGRAWERQEAPVTEDWVRQHTPLASPLQLRSVSWDGSRYWAVGDMGRVIESTDGRQWRVSETGKYHLNGSLSAVIGDVSRGLVVAAGSFLATLSSYSDL